MRLRYGAFARTPRIMTAVIYVALGGAIGASGRYWLSKAMAHNDETMSLGFPVGTFSANVIGGFLMGLLAGYLTLRLSGYEDVRLFLGVGVLGGFTTFSAFSLEAIMMLERKAYGLMASYVASSVICSLLALFMGLFLARKVLSL